MSAADTHGGAEAEWRMCAHWLLRCLSSSPDILAQAQSVLVDTPGATVVDLLNCLTDGVLLCHILPAISNQQVTPEQLPGFKMATLNSQFAFRQNLNLFLSACETEFGLSRSDMFAPDDLLSQENVGGIIRTLSLLSNSDRAKQTGIEGFTVANSNGDARVGGDFSSDYCNLMATATAKRSQQQQQQEQQNLAVPALEQSLGGNYMDAAAERVYETIMNKTLEKEKEPGAKKSVKEICMEELVTTERTYVETLGLLVDKVMRLMKESQSSWMPVEVDAIFEYLPELHSLHKKLLREMEVATQLRGAKPLPIVLIGYKDQLLIYGDYCAHMSEAISLVDDLCRSDRRRQEELQRHLSNVKAQFKLTEYLAVPMQRVLRYHLLVRSLMDYDRKEGGKDKEMLKEAHDAMCDVATYVNETKRDMEMRVLINQIQTQMLPISEFSFGKKSKTRRSISSLDMPGKLRLIDYGRLEQDGDLRVANDANKPNGGNKLRVCFLWTRMFLLAKPKPGLTFKAAFAVKPSLSIREVDLTSSGQLSNPAAAAPSGSRSTAVSILSNSSDAKWTWAFLVSDQPASSASPAAASSAKDQPERVHFLFLAKTREARTRWLEAFQRAKDDVAPANYSSNGYYFERRTLDPPAICTVCHKLIHGCFFQGYKCRKSGHVVHKQCIPSSPIGPPAIGSHRAALPNSVRPQSLISPAPPRSPMPGGAPVVRRDTISYVAPMPPDTAGHSPRSPISPGRAASTVAPVSSNQPPRSSVSTGGSEGSADGGPPAWSDYYVGIMVRDNARDALMPMPVGTFLVRESQGSGEYAVSLRHADSVKHMRVQRSAEGYRLSDNKTFPTVPELIAYFCTNNLSECFRELDSRLETAFKVQQKFLARQSVRKSSGSVLGWAPVVCDYSAPPSVGHVSLSVGEIVAVLSQEGSLRSGRKLNGQVGLFPADCVGPMSASPIE